MLHGMAKMMVLALWCGSGYVFFLSSTCIALMKCLQQVDCFQMFNFHSEFMLGI